MRLVLAIAILASLAPATAKPVTPEGKRWCFFGIIGDSCGTTTTKSSAPVPVTSTTATTAPTTPVIPTSSEPPSVSETPTTTPATTATVAPTSVPPSESSPAVSAANSTSPSATPTNTTLSYDPYARVTTYAAGNYFSAPLPTPFAAPAKPAWGSLFPYQQPPIPNQVLSADPSIFTASGAGAASIAQQPQTRTYTFNLGYSAGSPSGFERSMMTINNQYPGPLIEANQGDTLVITVHNGLDIPQSIHWHGMRQMGSNVMDGVPGISQCPIPPGGSFTYRFTLNGGEMGTYWYHSHYGNTLADGIVGGLIVHAPQEPLKLGQDYDDERIVYLSDFMDDQSQVIVDATSNLFHGYRGLPIVTTPDAILVNGVGQTDCLHAQAGVPCYQNNPAEIKAAAGTRVRLRLINTGAHAMIRFSIDGHALTVVEADDTPLQPVTVHEVPINTAQRYSVIVTLDQGAAGSSFWMRAQAATFCINPLAPAVLGSAILRYTDASGNGAGSAPPASGPWGDLASPQLSPCLDLDHKVTLTPSVPEDAPTSVSASTTFNSLFGVFIDKVKKTPFIGFGINFVTYTNYINNPLLARVMRGMSIPGTEVTSVTFSKDGTADIIINVLDPPPLSHPFHLHGRPFYIVGRGTGVYTFLTSWLFSPKTKNPLRRDTITIPSLSWAILRVKLDDPGVWPLHCHIGWHLAVGKMAVVVIRPDAIKQQQQPSEWQALCAGTNVNEIGPAKRYLPPYAAAAAREQWMIGSDGGDPFSNANGSFWPALGKPYVGPVSHPHFDHEARTRLTKRFADENGDGDA